MRHLCGILDETCRESLSLKADTRLCTLFEPIKSEDYFVLNYLGTQGTFWINVTLYVCNPDPRLLMIVS